MLLTLCLACLLAAAQQGPAINPDGVVINGPGQRRLLRPGEEISIYGRNLGPATPCQGARWSNAAELCGTSVRVGPFAAFVISAQENQVNARLPYNLPTEGQLPVIVTHQGLASTPQLVAAAPYDAKVRLLGQAMTGMPIWVDLDLPNPPVRLLRYPLRIDPVDLNGHTLELRREGALLTPRQPGPDSHVGGLSGIGSVGTGSFLGLPREPKHQNRLPLHLLYPITQPGHYEVRYVGYSLFRGTDRKPHVLVRSPWVAFSVIATTPAARQAWLTPMLAAPPQDPVEWISDYLPSLLASPDTAILPAVARALHHPDHLLRRYTVAALRIFNQGLMDKWLPQLLHDQGPTPELAYALPGTAFQGREAQLIQILLPHLQSASPVVQAGVLRCLYLVHVGRQQSPQHVIPEAVRHQVADRADALLATRNREVLHEFALFLGTWRHARSEQILRRLIEDGTAGEQARIALRWIQEPPR